MNFNMITVQVVWIMVMFMIQLSQAADADQKHQVAAKRSVSTFPITKCDGNNEGDSAYNPVDPSTVWLCKSSVWKPHKIVPSTGKTKELSAKNCKQIKETLSTDCGTSPQSGVYWVQNQQIYCDMTIDGGGWTLVWQHTYLKYNPLSSNMFYFSDYNQSCVKNASHEEWCNVPNKAHFNPTEQMIVAYHKGTIVYAYKGYFNRNIDHHWTGAILLDAKKVIDKCSSGNGISPAPSVHISGIFGLTFDKHSPTNYYNDCDTYERGTTLTMQTECRWHDCWLPSDISSMPRKTNMTMAIFVR